MSLVRPLLSDRVDLVGDVHGEIDALRALLHRLGCDPERGRADRPLVFVGDLVDRGPDSVAVVELVASLVEQGLAQVVLGNHELSLLAGDEKEGNGWYVPRAAPDAWHDGERGRVAFGSREATRSERERIRTFLEAQPLVLESPELRVVHAAWQPEAVRLAREASDAASFWRLRTAPSEAFDLTGAPSPEALRDPLTRVRFHEGLARKTASEQLGRPAKVLSSGFERPIAGEPRYLSGKWRLVERDPWWERDDDERAVVFGHHWRRREGARADGEGDPFAGTHPAAWFGKHRQAFCVDYSVGYRFRSRHRGHQLGASYGLAALRWPERTLVFDDREAVVTVR